jgi:Alw26I/Eco31I/Esp3I family type II restriction m6 adenine DNA methyltransferase
VKSQQDVSLKDIDILIETTRIMALDLVISRYLCLDEEEVVSNPKIGITCISNRCLNNPEIYSEIFTLVFRYISYFRNSPHLTGIEKLDRYNLVKILETIYEISVYEPAKFIKMGMINPDLYINRVNGTRRQWGAFYTPTEITEFICENTIGRFLDNKINNISKIINGTFMITSEIFNEIKTVFKINIIDPACGPGTFLSSSLKVLASRRHKLLEIVRELYTHKLSQIEKCQVDYWTSILENEDEFLKYFVKRLYGVDLDSAALECASICLSLLSGYDPLRDGLKTLYMVNLKEGNSLISEYPPKSVKLDPRELQRLLDLRKRIYCDNLKEKSEIVKVYKDVITQLQYRTSVTQTVRRASDFFKDVSKKMAFCWELEFPEVFYTCDGDPTRGFDLLVMNPPYDLLKPNRLEYTRLYSSRNIPTVSFEDFKRNLTEEVEFYRKSCHYSLSINNVLNLYKIMLERALQITSSQGMLGFIVPSTLLCDESTARLRKEILNRYRIEGIFDFPESARVFRGVSQAVCIMIINKSQRGNDIPLVTNLTQIDNLEKITPSIISMSWVKDFPDYRIPKVTETGWKILQKIHINPKLSDIPWILNLRGEVDLTLHKDYISAEDTGYPLIRGADISRYVLKRNYKKWESFVHKERFLNILGDSIKSRHIGDIRIAGQQISNMMQRWRLKFCMVEKWTFLANSCNYIYIKDRWDDRDSLYLYLLALLNSTLLNWRFKLTNTNNHVSNMELGMLPVRLIDMSDILERRIFNMIVERVRHIMKYGVNYFDPHIESAIFFLYGLTEDEVKFILHTERVPDQETRDVLEMFINLKELIWT